MDISILNLNIMHGKNTKVPWWPMVLPKAQVEKNLTGIAEFIAQYNPDIIALQEVDTNSRSNGKIDQLNYLNSILKYPYTFYGPECETPLATFGNAVLSRFPLTEPRYYKFMPCIPTPRKGFFTCNLELEKDRRISFTNLHTTWLNYFVPNHRARELKLVSSTLKSQPLPLIVAGDFNDEYISSKNQNLKNFMQELDLHAFAAEDPEMKTFSSDAPFERIDWVLLSSGMHFKNYETISTRISDHLPIFTTISL